VEPKIPKSSEKGSKRIKAQKLRNARQILDLAIPDKIWPRSQKPKKNKGRHPLLFDAFYGIFDFFFLIQLVVQIYCNGFFSNLSAMYYI